MSFSLLSHIIITRYSVTVTDGQLPNFGGKRMEKTKKVKTRILLYGVMILLCTVIAMQVLADDHSKDKMKPSATGWQHLALTNVIGETPKNELARNINKLGREGWELVSVENFAESGTTTKTIFYFKRPL
jgi:hypothetical protein